MFQFPVVAGLIGVVLIVCIAASILVGNSSVALGATLFSMIIGTPISLHVMGRTPSVYWIDIVFPVVVASVILRISVQKKGFPSVFSFGEIMREYLPILLYLLFILAGLTIMPPYDSLKSLVLGYHLLMSVVALIIPSYLIHSDRHVLLINRTFPLLGLFLLGAFGYSVYSNELGAAYLIDDAFHGSISIGWARSNFLAAFFVISIVLNISAVMVSSERKIKALSICTIFALSICILFIASIGAIISLVLTVLLFLFIRQKNVSSKVIIAIIFLAVFIFHPAVSFFSGRLIHEIERYGSGTPVRMLLWQDAWDQFLTHPLLGVGLGNKGFISKANLGLFYPTTHNFILQSLAETGILGTTMMLVFYAKYMLISFRMSFGYTKAREKAAYSVGIFLSIIAMILHGLVEPNLSGYSYRTLSWFLIALIPVYARLLPSESESRTSP